jgi:hypothetical protein
LSNLVSRYYKSIKIAEAKQLTKGVICWAPAYYLPSNLSTAELVHYDPNDERLSRYAVIQPPANLLFNHSPVHELHLENNEELLILKAKRRRFVIFCEAPNYCGASSTRLTQQKCCLGLPFWTFHDDDSEEFIRRIKTLEYPWWIYVPEDKTLRMPDSFIRLDRPQIIPLELIEPLSVSLHEDALYLISEWFRYYATGDIESIFLEDRATLMKA